MIVDVQAAHKGTDFKRAKVKMATIPRIGESIILPKLGYLTVWKIEHDYTQNPVQTTLICR